MSLARRAGATLARAVFPGQCAFCGMRLDDGRICRHCRAVLPWIRRPCVTCGQPMPSTASPETPCAECQLHPPDFERARAPLRYEFPVDAVIRSLKFRRCVWLGPAFAELLLPLLEQEFPQADALIPVPLHRWRQAGRGFNQATEICNPLGRTTGLIVLHDVSRTRPTRSQSGLTAAERRKNLRHAFAVRRKLACRRPVIVDDVMTTGETCNRLAKVLRRAGASSVGVLTVARAVVR